MFLTDVMLVARMHVMGRERWFVMQPLKGRQREMRWDQ